MPTRLAQPLSVKVHRLPDFTSIKVVGKADLESFVQLIDMMAEDPKRRGDRRVLVDLLEVTGELKFTEHFQMGDRAARRLQHIEKIASVVPAEKITRTSEKVAVTKGLQLRVFTSMNEAIRWLSQPADPKVLLDTMDTDKNS